jgi:hypothetical protein
VERIAFSIISERYEIKSGKNLVLWQSKSSI